MWGANFWGRIAATLAGVKVISTEHNVDEWKGRFHLICDRMLSILTYKVIAVSNKVKDFYIQNAKLPSGKIEAIHNGIDTKKTQGLQSVSRIKKELGIKDGEVVLAVVGRLVPQKGHVYFLKALKQLLNQHGVKGLIVGTGPLEEELKQYSRTLELNGKVIFTGFRKDVSCLLDIVDILVMPSLREGLPMVALEAMASGLPVVATDVGGTREAVVNSDTGFLVPSEDVEKLSTAIAKLIKDKTLRKRMGLKGRERVRKYFSIEKMVEKYKLTYEKINGKV